MSFWNGTEWVSETPAVAEAPPAPVRPSRTKRLAGAVAEGALIAALTFGLIAGSAFAGKGGGKPGGGGGGHNTTGGSGTLAWRMVDDVDGNGSPNYGDTIRFDVSTNATTQPNVSLKCSQGGTVVYSATTGYYADYPWPWTNNMTLSSQAWTGGAASCTAVLQSYSGSRVSTLGTQTFTAGG